MDQPSFTYTTSIDKIRRMTARKKVVQGGTSASKTWGILPILIDKAARHEGREISVVSESIPHLRRGALKDFLKIMQLTGRYNPDNYNMSRLVYTFHNGSYIEFFSADQEDKLRGARRTDLFVNEANNITFEAYHQLAIRTSGEIILDFNPTHQFWAHTEVLQEDDSELLILTYKDNEACPENVKYEIQQAEKKALTSEYWSNWVKVYVHGQVGSLQGTIFQDWELIDEIPQEARYERTGLDFGYSIDPTAIVDLYSWNGGVIMDEVCYEKRMSNRDIAEVLNDTHLIRDVVGDCAEPKSIDDIKTHGVQIKGSQKGPDSIKFGIKIMHERPLYVTKSSTNLITEFRNYKWRRDKDNNQTKIPEDAFNHGIDAARYAYVDVYHNPYSGEYHVY